MSRLVVAEFHANCTQIPRKLHASRVAFHSDASYTRTMTNTGTTRRSTNSHPTQGGNPMDTRYEQTPAIERQAYHSLSAESPVDDNGETTLLSPAAVLPEQFYARDAGSSLPASGVRALMGAILED